MDLGICYIKEEFRLPNDFDKPKESDEAPNKRKLPEDSDQSESNNTENAPKKQRKRGQNKDRAVFKDEKTEHLCNSLINGPGLEKCEKENCRYVHDLDMYLRSKLPDIDSECPIYTAKGFCPRGITCRFSKSHLDENMHNIKASHYKENETPSTTNGITPDMQIRLRKYDYNFSRCGDLLARFEKEYEMKTQSSSTDVIKTIGPVIDEETNGRDKSLKPPVDFRNKLILAPLTTVGNLPFRRICKEFGADITCGEMACCLPLIKGVSSEWALTKRHISEDVFGIQICGSNPNVIAKATQLLQETCNVDYIDLNIGCPIDLIYQHGGGCALMRRTRILELATRTCSALNPNIPFTVKMRTGIYSYHSVAHELAPIMEDCGAGAITVHGRSREQRYMKYADWEYIEKVASKVINMPVIGNGDIFSFQDFMERKTIAPHVTSVMIGRGALIKPWIFKEIKEKKTWDPSSSERMDIMKKYVNYGLEHWGSDTKGIENTRRFLLEWQSFLYRYVPHGLVANPPHKINQRPQKFRGRDEMETLLCSPNASDWVKISEMLLGPVPTGFTFVPKHKANSY